MEQVSKKEGELRCIYIREGDLNLATAITSDDLSFVVT